MDWSKLGKEYIKAIYCHLTYLTYTQNTSFKTPNWNEAQAGIKISRRKSTTSDMQMIPL